RDALLPAPPLHAAWPAEVYVFRAAGREALAADVRRLEAALAAGAEPEPAQLAHALWRGAAERTGAAWRTLALAATSPAELRAKRGRAEERLDANGAAIAEPGIQFAAAPYGRDGHVAVLFPGQGSQSVDMLRDLALHFGEVRHVLERFDATLAGRFPEPLSRFV